MKKTIKELLIEWWAKNTTTRMALPMFYTYDVNVDGKTKYIESISRSLMYNSLPGEKTILQLPSYLSGKTDGVILSRENC